MFNQQLSINNFKKAVKSKLEMMDAVIASRLENRSKLIQEITYHIINSGGKRLRPALTILCAEMFNYHNGTRHIKLAAAVEFIHTATLLHDDVVDHSRLRRGLPTANKNWGNKESILVGDFLLSQAFLLMSEDRDLGIIEILSKTSSIIAEGEVKQLNSISNLDLNLNSYIDVITSKTAELFAASCKVGAAIASNVYQSYESMYNFGLNLGIAFQIIDDVLDYTANTNILGKEIGDDFREGKSTLPIIVAYQRSSEMEKLFWHRVIIDKDQKSQDFEEALNIIKKYRAIEECRLISKRYIDKAKECLAIAPESDTKKLLLELLDYSLNREF